MYPLLLSCFKMSLARLDISRQWREQHAQKLKQQQGPFSLLILSYSSFYSLKVMQKKKESGFSSSSSLREGRISILLSSSRRKRDCLTCSLSLSLIHVHALVVHIHGSVCTQKIALLRGRGGKASKDGTKGGGEERSRRNFFGQNLFLGRGRDLVKEGGESVGSSCGLLSALHMRAAPKLPERLSSSRNVHT